MAFELSKLLFGSISYFLGIGYSDTKWNKKSIYNIGKTKLPPQP